MRLAVIGAAVLLGAAGTAGGAGGFQGVPWGASIAQTKKSFKALVPVATSELDKKGGVTRFQMPTTIADKRGEAELVYVDDKLCAVGVSLPQGVGFAEYLASLLTEKYGPAKEQVRAPSGEAFFTHAYWLTDKTSITLSAFAADTNLNYGASVKAFPECDLLNRFATAAAEERTRHLKDL